uniref:C2H2-type domain-containing protein n=1 Tax=Cyprinus carpio TaxID=7962 RepID=A0A8C1ZE42_CYPCA
MEEDQLVNIGEQSLCSNARDMSNGSVSNGAVFTDNNDSNSGDLTQPSNSSQPAATGAPAADRLAVSPSEFPNSDGSKRGRGRPEKEPTTEPITYNNITAQNENEGIFSCGVCGKMFPDDVQLRNHETQHGTFTGGVSTGVELVAVDGPTMISHPQSRFQENGLPADNRKRERTRRHVACDLCGKVFRDVYHLNWHKLSHSGEKPYACPVCGLRFKRKDRMSYHVRSPIVVDRLVARSWFFHITHLLWLPLHIHGAPSPQPFGTSVQLGKEKTLPCAEDLFSRYGIGLGQLDSTTHRGARPVSVELLEFIQRQYSSPTETFLGAPGAYGICGRSNATRVASYDAPSALVSRQSPEMSMAERHVPGVYHPVLSPNL